MEKSKKVIEAYHFLVSISPETHVMSSDDYTSIIKSSAIIDLHYKDTNVEITYAEVLL